MERFAMTSSLIQPHMGRVKSLKHSMDCKASSHDWGSITNPRRILPLRPAITVCANTCTLSLIQHLPYPLILGDLPAGTSNLELPIRWLSVGTVTSMTANGNLA